MSQTNIPKIGRTVEKEGKSSETQSSLDHPGGPDLTLQNLKDIGCEHGKDLYQAKPFQRVAKPIARMNKKQQEKFS